MQRRWIFSSDSEPAVVQRVQRELSIPAFLARLLVNRGFTEPVDADTYLNPKLRGLSAPELLPNMVLARDRVLEAIQRKERVVLYGDYDVDGTTSLAILARIFRAYGVDVACFLPLRFEEGYGLSEAGLKRCCELHNPQLLIAVDCGTTSVSQIAQLKRSGIDVVVLDHHELAKERPDCVALVNPKCGDDFHYLCSAGVVFKLVHALLKSQPVPGLDLRDFLDLVAMATLADIVPLIGENRIFVRHGLDRMENTRWPGIVALKAVSGVSSPVRGSDIGFRLGPRINAAGRLGSANQALQLLLTDDDAEANRLALALDQHNRERQTVERHVALEAEARISAQFNPETDATIVAGSRDWHIGVIGVVAGKIMRQFHRPAFIIGFDENGAGKGSGRSIEGLSLVRLLGDCASHLTQFGGHEMAAGITIDEKNLNAFRDSLETSARLLATSDMLAPKLHLHCEVPLDEIDAATLEAQDLLEPFGSHNGRPVFFSRGVTPAAAPRVMKEKHLRIECASGRRKIAAVYFNAPIDAMPRPPWDIAYTLEWNHWQGRSEHQIQIMEIRSSE